MSSSVFSSLSDVQRGTSITAEDGKRCVATLSKAEGLHLIF